MDNAAKFYIFDRDPESNTDDKLIAHFIDELTNPYDDQSEFGNGGMLILSYPAIESYVLSNFIKNSYCLEKKLGSEVKTLMGEERYRKSVQFNKFSEATLLFACKEFINYLKENSILYDIENYKNVNKSVFEIQENYFNLNKTYRLISLLSCAFLQLGIIELD